MTSLPLGILNYRCKSCGEWEMTTVTGFFTGAEYTEERCLNCGWVNGND